MWPMLEATVNSLPKYPSIVFAFAGDSTITRFFDMTFVKFKRFKYQEFFKKSNLYDRTDGFLKTKSGKEFADIHRFLQLGHYKFGSGKFFGKSLKLFFNEA